MKYLLKNNLLKEKVEQSNLFFTEIMKIFQLVNWSLFKIYDFQTTKLFKNQSELSSSQNPELSDKEETENSNEVYLSVLFNTCWGIIIDDYVNLQQFKNNILDIVCENLSYSRPTNTWSLVMWNNFILIDKDFFFSYFLDQGRLKNVIYQSLSPFSYDQQTEDENSSK